MMKNKKTDEIIRQEIVDGYDRYYRLAYSYVHNENDAMDIVQEGAYKAILKSDTLKRPEFVKTWIYRIMINESLNYIRKFKKPYTELDQVENSTEDNYQDFDLKNAVENLEEPDRTIIKLRFFEEMKIGDIAEILEENTNTIKSRLYRCMEKLKVSLQ